MKFFYLILLLVFAVSFSNKPTNHIPKGITASINGVPYVFNNNDTAMTMNIISLANKSYMLSIQGNAGRYNLSDLLIITIMSKKHDIEKGTFENKKDPIDNTYAFISYMPYSSTPSKKISYESPLKGSNRISVTVTGLDKFSIQGTFRGTLSSNNLMNKTCKITGQFNLPIIYKNY